MSKFRVFPTYTSVHSDIALCTIWKSHPQTIMHDIGLGQAMLARVNVMGFLCLGLRQSPAFHRRCLGSLPRHSAWDCGDYSGNGTGFARRISGLSCQVKNGCTTFHLASPRTSGTEVWLPFPAIPSGICGGQSHNRTDQKWRCHCADSLQALTAETWD